MIRIIYHRDKNRVSMEGHAGSGEPGHDLVCASVSILAYTLASIVKDMGEGVRRGFTVDLNDGEALISCNPIEDYRRPITLVFDTICTGFELLAQEYTDNVSFEVVDEKEGEKL